jgi:hypothetical protein
MADVDFNLVDDIWVADPVSHSARLYLIAVPGLDWRDGRVLLPSERAAEQLAAQLESAGFTTLL